MAFKNILLIDDDEDDQEIFLTAAQSGLPHVNCSALEDATIALKKLKSRELTPDAIFLDLNMPVMNGVQFMTEIKKLPTLSDIPIIIFSTSSNAKTIQQLMDLGAHDFVTKPASFDELVDILKRLLN